MKATLVVLLSLLCICVLSFAEEKGGAKQEISKWDGFRGLKWGDKVSDKKEFKQIDDTEFYTRKGDNLQIGDVKLLRLRYCFMNDKLVEVLFDGETTSTGNGNVLESLRVTFEERFGKPMIDTKYRTPIYKWNGKTSAGDTVEVYLSELVRGSGGYIMNRTLYDKEMDATMKVTEEHEKKTQENSRNRAKDGAKKDF